MKLLEERHTSDSNSDLGDITASCENWWMFFKKAVVGREKDLGAEGTAWAVAWEWDEGSVAK